MDEDPVNGVIAASFAIDGARAQEIARITDGEAAFIGNVAPRDSGRPCRTWPARRLAGPAVAAAVSSTPGAVDALFVKGQPFAHRAGPPGRALPGHADADPVRRRRAHRRAAGGPLEAVRAGRVPAHPGRALAGDGGRDHPAGLDCPSRWALARRPGAAHPAARRKPRTRSGAASSTRRCPRRAAARSGALARAFSTMVGELKRRRPSWSSSSADLQRRPGDVTLGERTGTPAGRPPGRRAWLEVGAHLRQPLQRSSPRSAGRHGPGLPREGQGPRRARSRSRR